MKLTKEEILKKYLTEREKGTWNAIIEEGKFMKNFSLFIKGIDSPIIKLHLYSQIQPELNRLKDEKIKLETKAQTRYENDLREERMNSYLRK